MLYVIMKWRWWWIGRTPTHHKETQYSPILKGRIYSKETLKGIYMTKR